MNRRHRTKPIDGKPDPDCDYGTRQSQALWDALDGIKHYHAVHADNCAITRFRDFGEIADGQPDRPIRPPKDRPECLILIVTDPEWIDKVQALISPEFPEPRERIN
jgi:hypothetical protein